MRSKISINPARAGPHGCQLTLLHRQLRLIALGEIAFLGDVGQADRVLYQLDALLLVQLQVLHVTIDTGLVGVGQNDICTIWCCEGENSVSMLPIATGKQLLTLQKVQVGADNGRRIGGIEAGTP